MHSPEISIIQNKPDNVEANQNNPEKKFKTTAFNWQKRIAGGSSTVGPGGMDPENDDKGKKDNSKDNTNPKIYNNLEKQLKSDGPKSILKALESAKKTLREHIMKIENVRYKSAIKTTIKNVTNQIKTYE